MSHDRRGSLMGDRRREPRGISRRGWLRSASGTLATWPILAQLSSGVAHSADSPGLIVRSRRPLDLETPVQALDTWLTPADRLFVRSHFGSPALEGPPWKVEINGQVDRPTSLVLKNLDAGEQTTVAAVLQCSGNGRAFFRPVVPGLPWERGAVGHAEWSGVRLADLLQRAGIRKGAAHVHFLGADGPPSPKTPLFLRSIPLAKALEPTTLLATRMNGEPLPTLHGGPLRLVVPGWAANHWMKWVRWIKVSDVEAPGVYQQSGYRMPKVPGPPDAILNPSDLVPVTALNVKSLITSPAEGSTPRQGPVEVRGVAWTGEGFVTKVEVHQGLDGGWREAELLDPALPFAWRRWRIVYDGLPPGEVIVRARATDSRGETQPETTPWNKSGYLWNGIDRVTFNVGRPS